MAAKKQDLIFENAEKMLLASEETRGIETIIKASDEQLVIAYYRKFHYSASLNDGQILNAMMANEFPTIDIVKKAISKVKTRHKRFKG